MRMQPHILHASATLPGASLNAITHSVGTQLTPLLPRAVHG